MAVGDTCDGISSCPRIRAHAHAIPLNQETRHMRHVRETVRRTFYLHNASRSRLPFKAINIA
jgi:hypothetical protein